MMRVVMLMLTALSAAALISDARAQQLYRWTDEKGRVHITDTPPPPSAKGVQRQKPRAVSVPSETGQQGEQQTPYELSLAMKDYPVSLYTSPMCKEPCQRARDHLNRRGVPFREVQVWDTDSNEELKRVSGSSQVPTLTVGGSVQKGYETSSFDELLDSARYPKAGSVRPRAQAAPATPEGYTPPGDSEPLKAQPVAKPPEESRPRGPYAPR
jgi:glutaredoxin